jgi:probable rRNA maturation factor
MALHIKRRKGLPGLDVRKFRRRAERLLKLLELQQCELSVLLTNDAEMTDLNRTYRNRNRTTDVLSFPQLSDGQGGYHPAILGDVVISVTTARRQAKVRRSPLLEELTILLVHGVLHLIGHEHEKAGRKRAASMRREQRRLVALLEGKPRP